MRKLYIVCGSPAAGKSTYAKKLAQSTQASILDVDTCTERLVQVSLHESGRNPNDRDSQYFKETYREPIYQSLFAIALENITQINVIIVGPFTKELRDPMWIKTLTSRFQTEVEVHYLWCRPEIRKSRMIARGSKRDIAKLENKNAELNYFKLEEPPVFPHIFIDTSNLADH